jgi:hypothetical protein
VFKQRQLFFADISDLANHDLNVAVAVIAYVS